jgi:putative transposase
VIISIIREGDAGAKVTDLCRKHGMSDATFYKWKAKFAGMDVSQLRRLKDSETENSRLKRMYADLSLTSLVMMIRSSMRSRPTLPRISATGSTNSIRWCAGKASASTGYIGYTKRWE